MGSDWKDDEHFESLRDYCDVVYLDRTEGISTTKIKVDLYSNENTVGKNNANDKTANVKKLTK